MQISFPSPISMLGAVLYIWSWKDFENKQGPVTKPIFI